MARKQLERKHLWESLVDIAGIEIKLVIYKVILMRTYLSVLMNSSKYAALLVLIS